MTVPDQPVDEPRADAPPSGRTGHQAVDAAIEPLGEVASLAPKEQVAAYVEAHRALQETLGTIEER